MCNNWFVMGKKRLTPAQMYSGCPGAFESICMRMKIFTLNLEISLKSLNFFFLISLRNHASHNLRGKVFALLLEISKKRKQTKNHLKVNLRIEDKHPFLIVY